MTAECRYIVALELRHESMLSALAQVALIDSLLAKGLVRLHGREAE
jgi:hypothetical protein